MAKFYQVGGSVRDRLLGRKSKDIDYSVEAESFDAMREAILSRGGRIFLETPEYFTIRALVPGFGACDYVLCRKDGIYKDGRRPDSVSIGTIYDDLARRDFTMNAIALSEDGEFIDPFDGRTDIRRRMVRCVGSIDRIYEDSLRLLRALRFHIVLDFDLHSEIRYAFDDYTIIENLKSVSIERVFDELNKALAVDSVATVETLAAYPMLTSAIFRDKLHLQASLKDRE